MVQDDSSPLPGPRASVLAALRALLRPLVRGLLDHRVAYPTLSKLLKGLYVDVADREFSLEDRPQTTTRISLLTGIHRKDVKRLREEPQGHERPHGQAALGALIVARWTSDEDFLDPEGEPLRLPKHGPRDRPSFDRLVESVSRDIRPRTVLDEWLRLGVAAIDSEGRVGLHVNAFVPEGGFDEKVFFFGRNTRDHLAAATHNLRGDLPALPDRAVYYGGLTESSTVELAELAERAGMEALQKVNRKARALKKRDADRPAATRRMTLGFYFFRGPEEGEEGGP